MADTKRERASFGLWSAVAAAFSITLIDGFDSFSLSLVAPRIAAELSIPMKAFGPIFASTIAGMIGGAVIGGWLADRFGRLRVLLYALCLFGLAALTMPHMASIWQIMANRMVAGVGLAVAAPLAVSLLSIKAGRGPSDLAIAIVWSGIPMGGVAAAAFDYLVSGGQGWHSIFIVGGCLPVPVAIAAYLVFGQASGAAQTGPARATPRFRDLFARNIRWSTIGGAAMFFCGYVLTSIFINWLPTILAHRSASPALITAAFIGINVGGVVGAVSLGWIAAWARSRYTVVGAWVVASVFALATAIPSNSDVLLVAFAICSYATAAGSQALSVAFASKLHRDKGMETTSIGFMTSAGRCGQVFTLSSSGLILGGGFPETTLFVVAGVGALLAATAGTIAVTLAGKQGVTA